MPKHVYTIIDGVRAVHMVGGTTDYDTSCGIDMNAPTIGHIPSNYGETREKIDCAACLNIWQAARSYRPSEFEDNGQ